MVRARRRDTREAERVKELLGIAAMVVATTLAQGAVPAANSNAGQVLAVERARVEALDRSDVAALEGIMADDVTYVHASGKIDTKQSYLSAIRAGLLHYISWQAEGIRVRVLGDTAVLTGEYIVHVTDTRVQPQPFEVDILVLSVYARRNGHWQQIAWQSTRKTAASGQQ
jgi:ketosteroid isomerase-like protein